MSSPTFLNGRLVRWQTYRSALLSRDGHRCTICGASEGLTLHHIKPKAIGGDTQAQNLVTICTSCHWAINRLTNHFTQYIAWGYSWVLIRVVCRRRSRLL